MFRQEYGRMIKFFDFTYVYSHIWLILPRDDRHFFFRHRRPLDMIATLAKNKNSFEKKNTCPQWNPRDVTFVSCYHTHLQVAMEGRNLRRKQHQDHFLFSLSVFCLSALLACCRNQAEERFSLSLSLSLSASIMSICAQLVL